MDKTLIKKALEELQKNAPKRKFSQSYDLIVNLKDLNIKKSDEQVDFYQHLPHGTGKKKKICGLVGPELVEESKKHFDKTITLGDFEKLKPIDVKKLADEFDYFVAQANIMPKVAQSFGRILGPRNKMPNPKAGCVVPPKANLGPLSQRLRETIRISAKKALVIQTIVGSESLDEEKLIENIDTVVEAVIHHLPKEINNVKEVLLKKTMSKAVKVM